MGDRCYWEAEVRKRDSSRFQEIIYGTVLDKERTEFEEVEMNYAAWDGCTSAAEEGLVFKVSHGAGGNYGAGAFCALGGKLYTVERTEDGRICVPVNSRGNIDPKRMEEVKKYIAAVKKVNRILQKEAKE